MDIQGIVCVECVRKVAEQLVSLLTWASPQAVRYELGAHVSGRVAVLFANLIARVESPSEKKRA